MSVVAAGLRAIHILCFHRELRTQKTSGVVLGRLLRDARRMHHALKQLNYLIPPVKLPVTIRGGRGAGLRVLIDPRFEKFLWRGHHEPLVADAIASHLLPGQTFWDVGAHIGYFTVQAARQVGPTGSVVAFEPSPRTYARLMRAIRLNGYVNVEMVPEAVGESPGRMPVYRQGMTTATATLDPTACGTAAATVNVGTLDGYLAGRAVPDLVKIDVEGYEAAVLRGAPRLIAKRRTKFLVEFMGDEPLAEARSLLDDYEFTALSGNHWLISSSALCS